MPSLAAPMRLPLVFLLAPAGCSLMFGTDDLREASGDASPAGASDAGVEADAVADAAPAPADAAPVDAAGAYTVAVTNGENGCGFANWQEGAVASGVPLTVSQEGAAVTAEVGGAAGASLGLILGSSVFEGSIAGAELELTLFGTTPFRSGGCSYTINGVVRAELDGDLLEGRVDYRASTNGSPDCGALDECTTEQRLNGTRPPS